MPPLHLRIAAHTEIATLVLLLTNLLTVHHPVLASFAGPVYGGAYLVVVLGTLRIRTADPAAKVLALIPGVGGLLALHGFSRRQPEPAGAPPR
ncbi:DUF3817 domain-containing protein [Streptomyces sp. NPDC052042]|uniref:DUF3817 domain-containing protein n=1 Tax=Streptomyces sp. NPDC052042 TaxID=3365683 RepID=UPI0037D13C6C